MATSPATPDDPTEQIKSDLFAGNKIAAIKKYRGLTGRGLRESKDFVEALELELRRTAPEQFTASARKGCGSAVLCVFGLVVTILLGVSLT